MESPEEIEMARNSAVVKATSIAIYDITMHAYVCGNIIIRFNEQTQIGELSHKKLFRHNKIPNHFPTFSKSKLQFF